MAYDNIPYIEARENVCKRNSTSALSHLDTINTRADVIDLFLKYALMLKDDHSKFCTVYFLKSTSEAIMCYRIL